jgi:hypothetical protein
MERHALKINQSTDVHSLVVPCFRCKRVGIYSSDENSPYGLPLRRAFPDQIVTTEFLGSLKCDATSCTFHVPLFSVSTAATTAAEREAEIASWSWYDLRCPAGHPLTNSNEHKFSPARTTSHGVRRNIMEVTETPILEVQREARPHRGGLFCFRLRINFRTTLASSKLSPRSAIQLDDPDQINFHGVTPSHPLRTGAAQSTARLASDVENTSLHAFDICSPDVLS